MDSRFLPCTLFAKSIAAIWMATYHTNELWRRGCARHIKSKHKPTWARMNDQKLGRLFACKHCSLDTPFWKSTLDSAGSWSVLGLRSDACQHLPPEPQTCLQHPCRVLLTGTHRPNFRAVAESNLSGGWSQHPNCWAIPAQCWQGSRSDLSSTGLQTAACVAMAAADSSLKSGL